MKKSRVFMLVTGALILGMAIGGLGIANAWSGVRQVPRPTAPVATSPASGAATDVVTPPSDVATVPMTPPSVDTTVAPKSPSHHAARHRVVARHDGMRHRAAATRTERQMQPRHSEPAHHAETEMHDAGEGHHAEGSGGCN